MKINSTLEKKRIFILIGLFAATNLFFFQNCSKNQLDIPQSSNQGSNENPNEVATPKPVSTEVKYSEKCVDFAANNFKSKDACLKDGRWHLVYETDANGVESYSSGTNALFTHLSQGADFKVVFPQQDKLPSILNANEECQQVYRSDTGNKVVYCLNQNRLIGEDATQVSTGASRVGSDGTIYCTSSDRLGPNQCDGIGALKTKWYAKY